MTTNFTTNEAILRFKVFSEIAHEILFFNWLRDYSLCFQLQNFTYNLFEIFKAMHHCEIIYVKDLIGFQSKKSNTTRWQIGSDLLNWYIIMLLKSNFIHQLPANFRNIKIEWKHSSLPFELKIFGNIPLQDRLLMQNFATKATKFFVINPLQFEKIMEQFKRKST